MVQLTFPAEVEIEGDFPVVNIEREINTDIAAVKDELQQLQSQLSWRMDEYDRSVQRVLRFFENAKVEYIPKVQKGGG